jgi:hypothetical protein
MTTIAAVDAFDLPDWLGVSEVVWTALSSIHAGHRVEGVLGAAAAGHRDGGEQVERGHQSGRLHADVPADLPMDLPCDLLCVDQAYPVPCVPDQWRRQVHQAWTYGQVQLLEYDGRLTLAVPGTSFTADLVLETVGRLAKAVGVPPDRFVAALRL